MLLLTSSLIPVPQGYPQPNDAEAVDAFLVSEAWPLSELFETTSSFDEAFEFIKKNVRKDVPQYDEQTVESVAGVILNARLRDAIDRHDSPFFSPGLKKDLARWGEPVTQADVLRTSFIGVAPKINQLLRTRNFTQLAREIAAGAVLDDPYLGNFSGYSASLISRILRELVSNGTISIGKDREDGMEKSF